MKLCRCLDVGCPEQHEPTPHCLPGGEAEESRQYPRREEIGPYIVRTFVTVPGASRFGQELWPLWGFSIQRASDLAVIERSGFELEDVDGFYTEEDAYQSALRIWDRLP